MKPAASNKWQNKMPKHKSNLYLDNLNAGITVRSNTEPDTNVAIKTKLH